MFVSFANRVAVWLCKQRWINRVIRRLLPPTGWVLLDKQFRLYLYPQDLGGPSYLVCKKGFYRYEEENRKALSRFIPAREGTFIDIGANIGIYSIDFYRQNKALNILAFEPVPYLYDCLQKTIDYNGLSAIQLYQKAVSNKCDAKSHLYLNAINDGNHSLKHYAVNLESKNETEIEVETVTLDNFIQDKNLKRIDAIKIDVEGFEYEVICGAVKTIQQYKPALLIECKNNLLLGDKSILKVLTSIPDCDYKVLNPKTNQVFTPDELLHLIHYHINKGYDHSDYLFYCEKINQNLN